MNISEYINVSQIASDNDISLHRLKKMEHFKRLRSYIEHFTSKPVIFKVKHQATYMDPLLVPAVEEYIREINEWKKSGKYYVSLPWEIDDYFLTYWERIHKNDRKPCERTNMKGWKGEVWLGFPYGGGGYYMNIEFN